MCSWVFVLDGSHVLTFQGMLLMDPSEKMDSLNLLRCAGLYKGDSLRCWAQVHTYMSHLHSLRTLWDFRWMAPIASLCLIPAVLILEPTVVR